MKDIDHKYKSNLKMVIITFTVHCSLASFCRASNRSHEGASLGCYKQTVRSGYEQMGAGQGGTAGRI